MPQLTPQHSLHLRMPRLMPRQLLPPYKLLMQELHLRRLRPCMLLPVPQPWLPPCMPLPMPELRWQHWPQLPPCMLLLMLQPRPHPRMPLKLETWRQLLDCMLLLLLAPRP